MKLSAGTGGNICPLVLGLRGDFCDGLKRPEVFQLCLSHLFININYSGK